MKVASLGQISEALFGREGVRLGVIGVGSGNDVAPLSWSYAVDMPAFAPVLLKGRLPAAGAG